MVTVLRTANAGVLLEMDGVKMLLDGVCNEVYPYPATPAQLRQELLAEPLDALVYTHTHEDHYDPEFVNTYHKNFAGPVMGPAEIPFSTLKSQQVGTVTVTAEPTRHIGKAVDLSHYSYCIQGSKCIWFMGDATPLQADGWNGWPSPDLMIVPYGFVIGRGWQKCKELNPEAVIVIHLPEGENDIYGLRKSVDQTVENDPGPLLLFPKIRTKISLFR